ELLSQGGILRDDLCAGTEHVPSEPGRDRNGPKCLLKRRRDRSHHAPGDSLRTGSEDGEHGHPSRAWPTNLQGLSAADSSTILRWASEVASTLPNPGRAWLWSESA